MFCLVGGVTSTSHQPKLVLQVV